LSKWEGVGERKEKPVSFVGFEQQWNEEKRTCIVLGRGELQSCSQNVFNVTSLNL